MGNLQDQLQERRLTDDMKGVVQLPEFWCGTCDLFRLYGDEHYRFKNVRFSRKACLTVEAVGSCARRMGNGWMSAVVNLQMFIHHNICQYGTIQGARGETCLVYFVWDRTDAPPEEWCAFVFYPQWYQFEVPGNPQIVGWDGREPIVSAK